MKIIDKRNLTSSKSGLSLPIGTFTARRFNESSVKLWLNTGMILVDLESHYSYSIKELKEIFYDVTLVLTEIVIIKTLD